jgi:hypothetical protein
MTELETRMSAVETRSEKALQLLQQAVTALFQQRERIEVLEGRLKAQTLVVSAMLQLGSRSDPEGFETLLTLLELTERDLARKKEDEPAIRELREILDMLRAIAGTSSQ